MDIIFRADGNSSIGLGHIMRSAALLQVLQPFFNCSFLTKDPEFFPFTEFINQPFVQKISSTNLLEEANEIANFKQDAIIVLDGYQFDLAYQNVIKQANKTLVYIDDLVQGHYVADAIINHAGGIIAEDYSCEEYTKLYLGPSNALVKPVFYQQQNHFCNLNDKKLLISLGGADPKNDTGIILDQLNIESFTEINIILGSANKHVQTLNEKYGNKNNIVFHKSLSSAELCQLMKNCPYAILSPSTICYEYMSVGGIVYLYQIADNQKNIKKYFLREKMAFSFEEMDRISDVQKISSLEKQRDVFDGKSAERLLRIFEELLN